MKNASIQQPTALDDMDDRPMWSISTILKQKAASCWIVALSMMLGIGCNPKDIAISTEQIALKNRSVALLENGAGKGNDLDGKQLAEAAKGFVKLSKAFPNDPLGPKNLFITLLSRLQKTDQVQVPEVYASICKDIEATLASLRRLTPNLPDADFLEARYYLVLLEREMAIRSMRKAAKNENATEDILYQLAQLLFFDFESDSKVETRSLLERGTQLSPNNILLSIDYLKALALNEDAHFLTEMNRTRDLLRPILARTTSKIPALLDGAVADAEKSNWSRVLRQVSSLRNVSAPEVAFQNDLNVLEPHELEYVQLNFLASSSQAPSRGVSASKQRFELNTKFDVVDLKSKGSAIATEDFDLDSRMDLVVASGKQVEVWAWPLQPDTNTASGSSMKLMQAEIDIECTGLVLADLDKDYQFRKDQFPISALPTTAAPDAVPNPKAMLVDTDIDVVAYGEGGVRLLRNDLDKETGKRSLTAVSLSDEMRALRGVRAIASIDFDHDSDLDLIISSETGISLWSNRGDWTFGDYTAYSSLPPATTRVDSILALDLDRNVLNDFLLGTESLDHPVLLTNNLHGRYQVRDQDWNGKLAGASRATEVIDVNQDACWDILSCGKQGTRVTIMKSLRRRSWLPESTVELSRKPALGLLVTDVDNDGYSDTVVWGSSGLELFRGADDGKLIQDVAALQFDQDVLSTVAVDVDEDGDDDLICLGRDGQLHFFENRGGNDNQHLELVVRADEDGQQFPRQRCNMHGVGSLIELKSNGLYQAKIVRGTRTRFGLAQKTNADILRVLWTNGIPNNVLNVSNRSTVFDQQNLGGSCPYLYAWNGKEFEFCTDCLWAAPIGLQFAQGVAAPTREWEYLKLDGRNIAPRNGRYLLQVTEELWEAAYFDSIELMAIDHPKEIDVYTNEKVGPAELADFRVHTVEDRIKPTNVIDQTGKDVTQTVLVRDQRYTKSWQEGFNQGLVEEHWLEVDMNESQERGDSVTLFMTGWVFPTCTSLNLAMSENRLKPKLHPPSIQVPDAQGKWTEVIPYAGFPGGKTKTIAIDLTGKFLSQDHRVRVVTNMELCWDEVFWTRGPSGSLSHTEWEVPNRYRISKLPLLSADLRYRGFSELIPQKGNAPKRFEHSRVSMDSIWPPMSGNFTRFGDVMDLITNQDDIQVVMGAGDSLTLEFSSETEPMPDGWVRDFIIYNVGWDKDADLNTIHGQTVEPLPFRAMKQYPYEPDESFPSSAKHAAFLEEYQTRRLEFGTFWNQIRDSHSTASPLKFNRN